MTEPKFKEGDILRVGESGRVDWEVVWVTTSRYGGEPTYTLRSGLTGRWKHLVAESELRLAFPSKPDGIAPGDEVVVLGTLLATVQAVSETHAVCDYGSGVVMQAPLDTVRRRSS